MSTLPTPWDSLPYFESMDILRSLILIAMVGTVAFLALYIFSGSRNKTIVLSSIDWLLSVVLALVISPFLWLLLAFPMYFTGMVAEYHVTSRFCQNVLASAYPFVSFFFSLGVALGPILYLRSCRNLSKQQ